MSIVSIPDPISGAAVSGRESVILKVLIIGDACVGKTSFVHRYVNGTFSRQYRGTIGVDFALKIVDWGENERLKVQLWDIAGQERFSYMTRVYYKDAHGCIIMFDLTNRATFLNVVKWKRDFDSKCVLADGSTVPCLLLGNKSDLTHLRQVTHDEVEKMTLEFNFTSWTEISVKDNLMVEDSMRYLLDCVMDKGRRSVPHPAAGSTSQNGQPVIKLRPTELRKPNNSCRC